MWIKKVGNSQNAFSVGVGAGELNRLLNWEIEWIQEQILGFKLKNS